MTKTLFATLALLTTAACAALAGNGDQATAKQADKTNTAKQAKPKFTISKETTYILGPLDKDGYIDYAAALNEKLSKGVTPENNANVLIWKALGPQPDGKPMPPEFFKLMGMEPPPKKGEYFVEPFKFLKYLLKSKYNADEIFDEMLQCRERPWTAKQYPNIAVWLLANEKPLALMVEATKRSHFFSPYVNESPGKGYFEFGWLPRIGPTRDWASALIVRAMLQVGEGKSENAWADILAGQRFSRQINKDWTLIEYLIAAWANGVANGGAIAFLGGARPEVKRLKICMLEMQALQPFPDATDLFNEGERYYCLDGMQRNTVSGMLPAGGVSATDLKDNEIRILEEIHRDPALRMFNRSFDRLVTAFRLKDRIAREKELSDIEKEAKKLEETFAASGGVIKAALAAENPAKRAQLIADGFTSQFSMFARVNQRAAEHAEQTHRNLLVAIALEIHERENGSYPKQLADLAPKYLPKIADDLFTGKSLIYRPSDKGYLLYSVGPNGVDDQGRGFGDEPFGGDDLAVRMPLPKLKKN